MGKIFNPDSSLMMFFSKILDLIILNLMLLIGCIPIVTIGTSTTALNYCVEQCRQNQGGAIYKQFWYAYRANFKQATQLLGFLLIPTAIIVADLLILYQNEIRINIIVLVLMGVFAVLCYLAMGFVFPLQARFSNTTKQTLKNALLMSILSLPKAIIVGALNFLPIGLAVLWPYLFLRSIIFWVMIGFAAIAYLNNIFLQKVFSQFYTQDTLPE